MCIETSPPYHLPFLDHIEVDMPEQLKKGLSERAVDLVYEMARSPITASENIMRKAYDIQRLPQEMTEEERQRKIAAGPPTIGKAVGALGDIVTDVASMVPGAGEEAVAGKMIGTKIALPAMAAILKPQRLKKWTRLLNIIGPKSSRYKPVLDSIKQIEKMVPAEF